VLSLSETPVDPVIPGILRKGYIADYFPEEFSEKNI
jgi:hypothetical protein